MDISELQRIYAGHPNTKGLAALLEDSSVRTIFLGGLHASAAALFVSSFLRENKQTFVFVLGDLEEAGYFYHDLTQLERIWYEGDVSAGEHYNWTRYYALNLHSVFYRGTVEWRCFNSTLHAGRAAAYINLCLAMSAQAIAQRSTVMRKTHSDNELFTFRVWLVRLGLNGPEFKNTRDHLLANLDGDRAWRYDKDSYEVNKKKKKNREMER